MPQRKKTIGVIFILFLTLGVGVSLITSCNNDNPVNPSQNIPILDSNVFDWEIDTININVFRDFYVADTDKIIVPGFPNSIYINGNAIQNIMHNDPDFEAFCSNGTSINNVFIGGGSTLSNKAKLKRWNGTTINDVALPNDSVHVITRIETVSENDVWLSTGSNLIYHYLNNSVETFRLNNEIDYGTIFKDAFNNINIQCLDFRSGSSDYSFYMFKYNGNNFDQLWNDSVSANSELGSYIGFSENKMLRSGKSSIYYFTGNNWQKYIDLNNGINPVHNAAGGSSNNILFNAYEEGGYQYHTFYYAGSQLFRLPTISGLPVSTFICMQYKYGKYYISGNYDNLVNFVAIAKLKNPKY